ncbi:MAG: WHG domain-containing protein, partial [Leptospira sp.]|nr:WHG domain-containing protein [Leptospira sp.]
RTYWSFARENKELHKLMFNMSHGQMYRKALPHLPTSYRVFLETVRFAYIRKDQSKEKGEYPAIARTMWAWMYGLIVLDLTGMLKIRRGTDPLEEGIAYFKMLLSFHRVI